MSQPKSSAAILYFSRFAAEEAEVKNFGASSGRSGNKKIAQTLIQSTKRTAVASGIPVFYSFSSNQHGKSFGLRLANAIEEVFKANFESVIVIGNDCPDLSIDSLQTAADKLKTKDLVIGPDQRGGTYLIGIKKSVFNRSKFIALPWESRFLRAELEKSVDSVLTLTHKSDINSAKDLNTYFTLQGTLSFLLKEIAHFSADAIISEVDYFYSSLNKKYSLVRGPPAIIV